MSKNNQKTQLENLFHNQKSPDIVSPTFQNGNDDNDNITVSFQYLQRDYGIENKSFTKDYKAQLLKKIAHITKSTWNELILNNKKSGFEIVKKSIINNLPPIITNDVDKLYILRFASQKCRTIGFRQNTVFQILYIDPSLSLYKH